jgi:hypothetical protein
MPPLEPGTPRPLPTAVDTTDQKSTDTAEEKSAASDAIDAGNKETTDTVDELYEVDAIVGRRPTKFGRTKGGRWKFGGNTYDYEVKWVGGATTFEPESELRKTHAEQCDDYDLKASTEQNFEPDADEKLPDETPTSSSFANFRNLVHLGFFCYLAKLLPVYNTNWKNIQVPNNRPEMLRSPEKEQWLAAERRELEEIAKKETWRKVKRPKKKPITCRWVYKLKPPTTLNPNPIFKARLVAHGYKQKATIDYSSTFAQVATLKAFRIMMWLSVFFGWRATQMDVKNAFLAGTLDKEIYMSPPPGYEEEIGTVLLVKSRYGLRQAPRIWYNTLIQKLHSLGFKELISDSCVFTHHTEKCYMLVFVDDIIIFTKNEPFRSKIENALKTFFDIKILGTLRLFIGMQVDTDEEGNVHIHQHDYVQKLSDVFRKYFTSFSSRINAPCDSDVKLSYGQAPESDKGKHQMKSYPYRQLVGAFSICWGPDLNSTYYYLTFQVHS